MSTDANKVAATLYNEHKSSLQRYVVRRVPGADASHVEDVVQETFAHTVAYLKNGKKVKSPKGFLFTTARNLITSMFYRSRQHNETDCAPDMDEYATNADTSSPEHRAMVQQRLDAFGVAIAGLPKRYQEAFVRRRVWGESSREIAAAMGVSEDSVPVYVAHGWRLLKEYCDKHDILLNDFFDHG